LSEENKFTSKHSALIKTDTFKRTQKSFNKLYQESLIWITCTDEMKKIYFDEDDNIIFDDLYLEEIHESETKEPQNTRKDHNNYSNERFVIDKFSLQHPNAKQWIEIFEKECKRLAIEGDCEKIEVVRLFLDTPCLEWYSATLTTLTSEAKWSEWKELVV
jgi:hypothetical protein